MPGALPGMPLTGTWGINSLHSPGNPCTLYVHTRPVEWCGTRNRDHGPFHPCDAILLVFFAHSGWCGCGARHPGLWLLNPDSSDLCAAWYDLCAEPSTHLVVWAPGLPWAWDWATGWGLGGEGMAGLFPGGVRGEQGGAVLVDDGQALA